MATEGPVDGIFILDLVLDREIDDNHTVTLTQTEVISLYLLDGTPAEVIELVFEAGEGEVVQQIKVSGNTEGTFPLKAVVTSQYYQQQGTLKEEDSFIDLTFVQEEEGFNGSHPGVVHYNRDPSGDNFAAGDFKFRHTNTVIGKILRFNRSVSSGTWGGGFALKVTLPNASVVYLGNLVSVSTQIDVTMNLIGLYVVEFIEVFIVKGLGSGAWTTCPTVNWTAKLSPSYAVIGSAITKASGIVYKQNSPIGSGIGVLNSFAGVVGDVLDESSPSPILETGTGATFTGGGFFYGTGTPVGGGGRANVSGYWSSYAGSITINLAPLTIGGINVHNSSAPIGAYMPG